MAASQEATELGHIRREPDLPPLPVAERSTIANVLVGITGTPALPAKIELAIDLHRTHGAAITGLSIIDMARLDPGTAVPIGAISYAKQMRDRRFRVSRTRAIAALDTFAEGCSAADVPVDVRLIEDEPVEVISNEAHFSDLIVLPVDGWFSYGLISDAETRLSEVLLRGAGPILAIGEAYTPTQEVVVGLDGSLAAANAFRSFVRMGLWPDARLHLVHAVEDGWPEREAAVSDMMDKALSYAHRFGSQAVAHVMAGSANDTFHGIIRETGAKAAVLGSDRRRLFADKRLTATTKKLTRDDGLSVLIVG